MTENAKMKAFVLAGYGPVEKLVLTELPVPQARKGHVLVRVRASSINPLDFKVRNGSLRLITGLMRPRWRVLGFDVAGEVDRAEHGFREGERVFAMVAGGGANAEYVSVPAKSLVRMPPDMTFEDAAGVPLAALAALQGLRDLGGVVQTSRVLINGASGGVGSFAVQIAKAMGAEVTAVCSTRNVEMVQGLRADHVLDYTRTDFTHSGERYDIVFDVVAATSLRECARTLRPTGTFVTTVPGFWDMVDHAKWRLTRQGKRSAFLMVKSRGTDLSYLAGLIEQGRLRPIIDRTFPFSSLREAHSYAEQNRSRGKNIITMSGL